VFWNLKLTVKQQKYKVFVKKHNYCLQKNLHEQPSREDFFVLS